MSPDSLCQWVHHKENNLKTNNKNPYANMILNDWVKTNSPFWNYWGQMIFDEVEFSTTEEFKNYKMPTGRIYGEFFEYGLPMEDATRVCEARFAKEIVKLTIQIVDPTVMVIEKDVRATFTDKLGVVGN